MANTYLCPECGTPNPADATNCKGCGHPIPPGGGVRETLFELDQPATSTWHWNVLFGTTVIVLVVQALMGLLVAPGVLWELVEPGTLTAIVLAVGGLAYFLTGLFAGRLSSGFTVKEPALGGFLAAAINWLLEVYLFRNTGLDLGVLAGIAVGWGILAALGGSAGETLQQRAEKRKRERVRARQAKA
ncbi:MAG: zinc ribbon domain-containing protein [Deltaproteobacteria bacterium]|nr:zinc ribbon domain-containing protein [Deltaproteobacteria bacterium]